MAHWKGCLIQGGICSQWPIKRRWPQLHEPANWWTCMALFLSNRSMNMQRTKNNLKGLFLFWEQTRLRHCFHKNISKSQGYMARKPVIMICFFWNLYWRIQIANEKILPRFEHPLYYMHGAIVKENRKCHKLLVPFALYSLRSTVKGTLMCIILKMSCC